MVKMLMNQAISPKDLRAKRSKSKENGMIKKRMCYKILLRY